MINDIDMIRIRDLEVFANHGVFPEENVLGQKFVISADIYISLYKAGQSDMLEDSVHYGEICHMMERFTRENTFKLLETLSERMAEEILLEYPAIERIDIEVKKPWAPIGLQLRDVSVRVSRGWHTAFIAMGSNMGDRKARLDMAKERIAADRRCRIERVSGYIETEPYGGVEQDDFLNAAMEVRTILPPYALLDKLHSIENEAGRERTVRWGPRTLDLDILLYDDLILDTKDLTIPHADMHRRDFVLRPMTEIAPYTRHPLLGKTMTELWENLDMSN